MIATVPMLHVRAEGRSFDIPQSDIDIGLESKDRQIKHRLADYLDIPENRLQSYVVDRHQTGNMTVRPQAVFG